jgi:hypothetical protein
MRKCLCRFFLSFLYLLTRPRDLLREYVEIIRKTKHRGTGSTPVRGVPYEPAAHALCS